jgi:2-oxoglutarate ferredoxin oxidoreductase subunit alpha
LAAARRVRESGRKVATAHLVHVNPMPANTGEVVQGYAKVLIPELNTGQLAMLIRSAHLVDARTFSKVQGQPIFAEELEDEILRVGGEETR